MSEKFIGFYLHYMPMREQLEELVFQFCKQLLSRLGMFAGNEQEVLLEGAGSQRVTLKECHMVMRSAKAPGASQLGPDGLMDLFLFQGDYVKALQDGTVLFNALKMLVDAVGDKSADELDDQLHRYSASGKSSPHLHVFYWHLARIFVTKLPLEFQIAFSVDCLLYGQWRVSHPNLIGLHLMMLSWMLGVKELQVLMPEAIRNCSVVVSPPFAACQHSLRLKINVAPSSDQNLQHQKLPIGGRPRGSRLAPPADKKKVPAPSKAK